MTEEIECPFCGEPGEIAADYDPDAVGDQVFVQDCAVCCRPWTVTVHVGADGDVSFDVQRSCSRPAGYWFVQVARTKILEKPVGIASPAEAVA